MILLDLSAADESADLWADRRPGEVRDGGGVLRPGDLVPSVRELSKQLVVNPNTVARAYRELQGEGLLEPVRGTGLQVAEGARRSAGEARSDFVRDRLRGGDRQGEADASSTPAEIEAILHEEWTKGNGGRRWPNGRGA